MKRIVINKKNLTREKLANPFPNNTLEERLINSKTIDLRNNYIFKDLGNGYCEINPKDKSKLLTKYK